MTLVSIIPAPAEAVADGGALDVSRLVAVTVDAPGLLPVAERFCTDVLAWTGEELPTAEVAPSPSDTVGVRLREDAAITPGEYRLVVDETGAQVTGADSEALYRGLTTLLQLIGTGAGSIPTLTVTDRPRWGWRGLSLDIVRHFVPAREIKRVIDVLALYKFSVLHLHLSDNEAWRLEIPSWPHLTGPALSGERAHLTLDDFADLVAYAADRFVTVVPELNMPGHVAAAVRAYPELNPSAGDRLAGTLPTAYLDEDSEAAWRFVNDVITTVAAVTPGPYLHVGGDEAFGMPDAAYARFVAEAVRIAEDAGKQTIGFQETSRADVDPGHTAQYWIDFAFTAPDPAEAREGGVPYETLKLVEQNFRRATRDGGRIVDKGLFAILSPSTRAYLDRPHGESSLDPAQETDRTRVGLQFYPATPLRDYLEWNPLHIVESLPADRIRGVEAALWAETIESDSDLESLLLPRLTATAEVGWAEPGTPSWDDYRARLAAHARLWRRREWNFYRLDTVDWPA